MDEPTPRPRRERLSREVRQARILDAAVEVFGRSGFREGSLQEVATAAGMTVPGLLHYYPSKVELLFAVLAHWQALQTALLETVGVQTTFERGRMILQRNLEHRGMMRLRVTLTAETASEDHPAHARMVQRYRETAESFEHHLAEEIARGDLPALADVPGTARALIALLDSLQMQHFLTPELDIVQVYETGARRLLGMEDRPPRSAARTRA